MTNAAARAWAGRIRTVWPWLPLAAVPFVVVLLAAADRHWKAVSHAGFCPADANVVIQAADFPAFLDALGRTQVGEAIAYGLPALAHEISLTTRLETGIRPTPLRWRVWFGATLLAGARGDEWGICVKPGLLARVAHAVNRFVGGDRDASETCSYGRFQYAWRDGYLIVSPWCDYVKDAWAGPATPSDGLARDQISLAWTSAPAGRLVLRASEGLPVSGMVACDITARETPLTLADAWPGSPLISVTASRVEDLAALAGLLQSVWMLMEDARRVYGIAPMLRYASYVCNAWGMDRPAPNWNQTVEECSAALLDVDFDGGILPMPGLALVLRSPRAGIDPHPLQSLVEGESLPFEWNGASGVAIPVLGESWTLCLAAHEDRWYAATQEPVMARIANRLVAGPGLGADISVRVNWSRCGAVIEEFLRQAAQLELVPGMDAREADYFLLPYARVVAHCGALRLDGRMEQGNLRFEGRLAETEATGPP